MNGPFYRNHSKQQPSRFVPVQQTRQKASPKVVSVPVHFISSEQPRTMSKASAVLKIQKVFRDFLVRKSVKKIASIGNEVSEIERRINSVEVVDLIRRDAKERLRVNETLMSLLFKLDSIRGFDCGVRDLRKAVTRNVISLQEKVDSIAQSDHQTLDSPNNDFGQIYEDTDSIAHPNHRILDSHNNESGEIDGDTDSIAQPNHRILDSHNNDSGEIDVDEDDGDAGDIKEAVKEVVEICNPVKGSIEGSTEVQKHKKSDGENDDRQLLDKLVTDNEKMMKLMKQISESSEMQTRMINSLSRRVEQLENAFLTNKLRRKKNSSRRRDKDDFCI